MVIGRAFRDFLASARSTAWSKTRGAVRAILLSVFDGPLFEKSPPRAPVSYLFARALRL